MKNLRKLNVLDRYGDTFPLILADMKRYNNRIRIKNESIAEHSFYVAYNIIKVGYDYNIDKNIINEAVSMAISHDFPESYTSDLPHDCKDEYPELRTILSKIETTFIKDKVPELEYYYNKLDDDSTQALLVHIGDAISVLQYCNREISLGNNTEDIKVIHNEICARIISLFEKLNKKIK